MKQKRLTDEELEKVFELLDFEEHHGIFCAQLFNKIRPMAEELRERRLSETVLCDAIEKDEHGKCEGYQKSETNDDPAEMCMECTKNIFYES